MRPNAVVKLLQSVSKQSLFPDEIIIVDGSANDKTKEVLKKHNFKNLTYFKVKPSERGLTKQRNFGVKKVANTIDVVCFLDDDTILDIHYFKNMINTYSMHKTAIAVGGYITNEVEWKHKQTSINFDEFQMDGFVRKLGYRNVLRKKLGLLSNKLPGIMPEFSNGFPISFLPPTNKTYEVEFFMGGAASYKKNVFEQINFSTYFEGYGLYEDLDFCLRLSKLGKLYVNTAAQLEHHHNTKGRPNKYNYGKMVVINGWYVWRVKYPNPTISARLKWNAIVLLQIIIKGVNIVTTSKRKEAFTEMLGRKIGWFSLLFKKPKIDR